MNLENKYGVESISKEEHPLEALIHVFCYDLDGVEESICGLHLVAGLGQPFDQEDSGSMNSLRDVSETL